MELTMGTMVTMVLLVAVLILGGFLVQRIFTGAGESVDAIDQQVKNEISKLFSEDSTRKIIIFPPSRKISIEKGVLDKDQGFAFSIRNIGTAGASFSYTVSAGEVGSTCETPLTVQQVDAFIDLGRKSLSPINIGPGELLESPILVSFVVPETAPACSIKYNIDITKDGQIYGSTVGVNVKILSN